MWHLYCSTFFQVIFFYYSCTWTAQLVRGVFLSNISCSCCFSVIMGPSLSFWRLFSFCQGCWKIRAGGSGVIIGAGVDGEGGKESGVTREVNIETLLETIISWTFTYVQSDTHTQVHGYIPWIHKSVIKKVGYGTNHKYTKYKIYNANTTSTLQ